MRPRDFIRELNETPGIKPIPLPSNRKEFSRMSYMDLCRLRRYFPEAYAEALKTGEKND